MGKKPAAQKMSLADLNAKFGGNMAESQLPSQSVGKDFGKAKGKGFRDIDGAREADDWRSNGPRKGKGKGDSEPSRADTGDWRGGGRDDRGGGFGDRGDRGGDRGGFGRRDREDTQAGKDDDWRGSAGRDRDDDRRGFGDRRNFDGRGDRGGGGGGNSRADDGNWRTGGGGGGGGGDRGGGESERPRLNLKPRSKPVPDRGDAPPEAPRIQSNDEDLDTKDSKEEEKKPAAALGGGGKYVPPAKLKAMEEEARKKEEREKENEDRRRKQKEQDRAEEEAKERRREEMRSRQRAEDERKNKEEEAKKEKKREEEAKKEAAEKARKMELKAAKEAEAREKREALKSASQAQKKTSQNSGKKQVFDASKIDSFVETCEEALKDESDVEKLVEQIDDLLTEDEWTTVHPIARLNEMLLTKCRGKQDEEVFSLVQNWAPMLNCLIEKSGIRRFKVKVLIEAQRVASKMGLPRLSPASALLEAFFDGLYRAEVIEEDYFEMWAVGDDDTQGKTSAMFQVTAFMDWMRGIEEVEMEEGEGEEEEDEEDDDEEEEDEIEANVPISRRK